jgi:hypothetical protein
LGLLLLGANQLASSVLWLLAGRIKSSANFTPPVHCRRLAGFGFKYPVKHRILQIKKATEVAFLIML